MSKTPSKSIPLVEVSPEIFAQVVQFMYTSQTESDDIMSLLQASRFLIMSNLEEFCVKALELRTNITNLAFIYDESIKLDIERLSSHCFIKAFSLRHMWLLETNNLFLREWSREALEHFIKTLQTSTKVDDITTAQLFFGISQWMTDSDAKIRPEKVAHFDALIDLIDFTKISESDRHFIKDCKFSDKLNLLLSSIQDKPIEHTKPEMQNDNTSPVSCINKE
jgi:hypothetical protein